MNFVEFYSYQKLHQSLKYKTPAKVYFAKKLRIKFTRINVLVFKRFR